VESHKKLQNQVRSNPNTGTINVLVLMVRFKNHQNRDCELHTFFGPEIIVVSCSFCLLITNTYWISPFS
jgi:hypothetical protein